MIFRSFLLVLGLVCIQSFTTAQGQTGPKKCCVTYQIRQINVKHIAAFEVTLSACSNPGVIFTLNDGRQVCADPRVEWVQKNMKSIETRLFKSN